MKKLFVSGVYRSGTTFLTRILNNHSKLWVTYDSVHFFRFSYNKFNPINIRSNYIELLKESKKRLFTRWKMNLNIDSIIHNLDLLNKVKYSDVYNELMVSLGTQEINELQGWGEKTVLSWTKHEDFIKMFPNGKVIHILRDPRDILLSFKNVTTEPFPGYLNTAFVTLDSFNSCIKHMTSIGNQNFKVIRYEDLISNPKNSIIDICKFIGIEFSNEMLNVSKFKDKNGNWWNGDSATGKGMKEFSNSRINVWQNQLNDEEIYFVELINKTSMPQFKYELSGRDITPAKLKDLKELLENNLLKDKYINWLKSGRGVEGFATMPITHCQSTEVPLFTL